MRVIDFLFSYERKTLLTLENIVKQCDRKIERQKQRAEQDTEMSDEDLKRIVTIYKQIAELTEQCECAADKDNIDEAMSLAKQIEQLKEAARRIVNPPEEKKIAVCEVSGNFMSSK
jgi:excinuclease UvrABC helicase subunit UvrB